MFRLRGLKRFSDRVSRTFSIGSFRAYQKNRRTAQTFCTTLTGGRTTYFSDKLAREKSARDDDELGRSSFLAKSDTISLSNRKKAPRMIEGWWAPPGKRCVLIRISDIIFDCARFCCVVLPLWRHSIFLSLCSIQFSPVLRLRKVLCTSRGI